MKRGTYLKTSGMILVFLLSTTLTSSAARTINVDDDGPADFNTIQAAINDANDGDTIIVSDGTYTGDGNRDIDFLGKAITLRSENGPENCIIDCQGSEDDLHRGFYFHSGEDANSVLDGFTITNGCAYSGGAIRCLYSSSPTITNCIIRGNVAPFEPDFPWYFAQDGGGIYCYESSATITNCHFLGNTATGSGGAIRSSNGNVLVSNCMFTGNQASYGGAIALYLDNMSIHNCVIIGNRAGYEFYGSGGGIFSNESTPTITNCTIRGNLAYNYGGGILCVEHSDATVDNSVLWCNNAQEGPEIGIIYGAFGPSSITISYSDVQGGAAGVYVDSGCTLNWEAGNIDIDPNFADTSSYDPNEWDHHLKSQAGRWEPSSKTWVQDSQTSPCIDGGNPEDPIGDEPFPNGGVINMGAYGGTAEASKSYFGRPVCEIIVAGDVNGDCIVNYLDFRLMALHWLRDESQ